ncbi:MAG: DUF4178 domain-containing protein [Elusimicrobiota bacterium]|nr:DUF4178 domain-containing protein [Elusimicrobiota bacterium]
MTERKCPSCGAMVPFRTSINLLAICLFCRSLVQRKDLDLEKLGVSAQLQPDGSPVLLGARGVYRGAPFEVVGRLQLQTPRGFWNEWSLMFADGRQGWLGEAQGTYAVSFKADDNVPALADLRPGAKVEILGRSYEVREVVDAKYLAAEGELPFKPPLGQTAPSADLIGADGAFGTLDYSDNPASVFIGEYQAFEALSFTGLKVIEGWA